MAVQIIFIILYLISLVPIYLIIANFDCFHPALPPSSPLVPRNLISFSMSLFACIWRIINLQHYISSSCKYLYTFQNDHHDQFTYNIPPCCCCLVIKSCPTVCDPMNYSIPGFPSLSSEVCSNSCPICHCTKILCTY